MHKRPASAHVVQVRFVDLRRFIGQQTCIDPQPSRTEMRETFAGNLWIEIFNGRDDAFDPRRNQRIGAGRCTAVVCVWFE